MPPKTIISKEDVLKVAIDLIKEQGFTSLNARIIAKKLNCSTNPIFRIFENMEELKKEVYHEAEQYYENYLCSKTYENVSAFLQMGLNYIYFAKEETNLFKFIFLSNRIEIESFHSIAEMANSPEILEEISKATGLNAYVSKELFSNIWLLTHGIACTVATNQYHFDEEEITRILIHTYKGVLTILREET